MKINTTRMIAILGSLCLVTSSFVGSTLAKYTTQVSGNDTARVAKFGVVLSADTDLFKASYAGNDEISVLSDVYNDAARTGRVIAPGTSGTATVFTIAGAPEVDVKLTASLGAFTMATLPKDTYTDYTKVVDTDNNGKTDGFDTFTLAEDYKPVKWTLKFTSAEAGATTQTVASGNLDAINNYLTNTLSREYDVEDDSFDEINGNYELSWEWVFDGVNDAADTYMGQIAAGVVTTEPAGYEGDESFAFTLVVEQID